MALFVMSLSTHAQVGIKTSNPQNTLHVNGSAQVVKDLNVGGNANTKGNSGNPGEYLSSNGPGQAPSWKNVNQSFFKVVFVGSKTNITPDTSYFHGTHTTPNYLHPDFNKDFIYNVTNKIDNTYIKYNRSEGVFKIQKSGYYYVSTYMTQLIEPGEKGGTAHYQISSFDTGYEYIHLGQTSGYTKTDHEVYQHLDGIRYYNAGSTFRVRGRNTKDFRLSRGSISISYVIP